MLLCMRVCSCHLFPVEKKTFFPSSLDKFKYSFHSKQQLVFLTTINIRKCSMQ